MTHLTHIFRVYLSTEYDVDDGKDLDIFDINEGLLKNVKFFLHVFHFPCIHVFFQLIIQ